MIYSVCSANSQKSSHPADIWAKPSVRNFHWSVSTEQKMLISLVCHRNSKALRQTKNLNLKSIGKLVYVFITILTGIFGIGLVLLSLANQLANFM